MRHVFLLAALAAPAALAQAPPAAEPAATADSTAVPDSVAAPAPSTLLRSLRLEPQAPPPSTLLSTRVAASIQPTTYGFGTGLRVTLPPGWEGAPAVAETGLPGYALYTFRDAGAHSPLAGLTLRVERVTGLNALLRERWTRGQTGYGYHGTRAVGPAATPLSGLALEVEGAGQAGAVVFVQKGEVLWAVQVLAPTAMWRARRAEALAVFAGVALP